jgi:hypothetical protein
LVQARSGGGERVVRAPASAVGALGSGHETARRALLSGTRPTVARPGQRRSRSAGWAGRATSDGLRARSFHWPPLRLARLRSERGSVCVVLPSCSRFVSVEVRRAMCSELSGWTCTATSARSRSLIAAGSRTSGRVPTTPAALELFAASLAPSDRVALEATGNAAEIARIVGVHVADVVVVSPHDTAVGRARAKTDRLDARTLARLLAAGELDAVWVPDEQTRAMRRRLSQRRPAGPFAHPRQERAPCRAHPPPRGASAGQRRVWRAWPRVAGRAGAADDERDTVSACPARCAPSTRVRARRYTPVPQRAATRRPGADAATVRAVRAHGRARRHRRAR